tara:strand:- start:1630 stop:2055 length:426 start_codon:yes stop_codon:yes gene_type:complete
MGIPPRAILGGRFVRRYDYLPQIDETEKVLHLQVAGLLNSYQNLGKLRWFATAREHVRGLKAGKQAQQMGARAGLPDIVVLIRIPFRPPITVFLELKARKGTLSVRQQDWAAWLKDAGYQWHLILEAGEVGRIIENITGVQ